MARRIIRKYQCEDCQTEWTCVHKVGDLSLDDCPKCSVKSLPNEEIDNAPNFFGKAPSVRGNVSKAADFTSRMLEKDYGIPPSMQVDNAREGDSYVKSMPNNPVKYSHQSSVNKKNFNNFMSLAKSGGGLGENQNLTGMDIINSCKGTSIPNPLKNSEFIHSRDK